MRTASIALTIAAGTSKTSVYFNESTRGYISDGCLIHTRSRENLKCSEDVRLRRRSNHRSKQAKQSLYTLWWRLGEMRYSSYSFLTSALDGGEWSASRSGRSLPRGKDPQYPLYRRLGGPQSRSGHMSKKWSSSFWADSQLHAPGTWINELFSFRLCSCRL
jgi:hypothetical protein